MTTDQLSSINNAPDVPKGFFKDVRYYVIGGIQKSVNNIKISCNPF